ncbi:hypothetical protein Q8A67_015699 [Cirrhinus molitorella]|uniref:C2H2-type domain-containing protein n=1 Tax=Cirrhinus molitorella TaxID=172907 RepID=A0AA88PLP1_9TELE|nr:hypothetical protein Q8A67_015699 [Cirrhinus molitorella]
MDGELPPWNTHGSHNSRVSYNTAVEHQEEHDEIGNSFADGEPMTSLSSCMSGAFQALLPDYNETSSAMSTDSDKYSCSPDNRYFIKPDTAVDEKIAVERMEKSDFSKDPLGEASASETHMLPPRCAQYGTHEKNQKLDQGSGNWTSVIKNALEMSNGMEMEQTLSMNECGSRMDYNPIYKGPETEANFKLKDNYQIAGFKLNEKQDGQGVKEEPDSFISVLSDGISKKKDVLEMEKNEDPSILDVGTFSGIREHKPGLLPGLNRSSYTPFSSSESFMKSEQFPEEDCTSHFQISDTTLKKEVSNPAVIQHAMSSLDSSSENVHKSGKKTTKQTLQCKDDPQKDVPTTFSELEADVVDVKGHQKERSFLKGKNKNTTSLLNTQSSLDSEGQTDPVSTSVAESSNILSPQNNPKKSKQKKRAHIIKAAKTPNVCAHEDMENMMISKTKPVKAKRSLKKATRTDDNGTTLLDTQPSTDTVKQADPVSNVGNEAESPVILSTPRKSAKKKLSDTKCKAVEQTTAQQSILNPLSESDDSIVQPTIERLRTRKTLDKKGSHNTVSENCEPAHLAPETDYSGVSQQNTEMTPSKKRKTDHKFTEAQTSTTREQDDVSLPPSHDSSSIVVSNPEKTVKARESSRNKTDNHLNGNLVEETSLSATVTQESSILPATTDSSKSSTLKKLRKKTATNIKNKAAEKLSVHQHEDLVAVPSKSGANISASSSKMTSKDKRTVENAIRQEVKDDHAVAPFDMQASVHSTAKKSKTMSGIKHEMVHQPAVDQTMQQEMQPFVSPAATEMDNSDVIKQKKTNVQMKSLPKKATKRKTHNTQAISDIREQSTVQQENSASNSKTNSRSEDMTKKCMKKRTSALKVRNNQPEDHVEHSTALSPPVSQSKDATQDPCIKTDPGNETAVGGFENQVSITTEDVASPQRSMKAAKKTHSNIQELAHREDKMSDVPSVVRGIASEKFETDSCDQHLKIAKKKSKKSVENVETHLSEDKNNGSNEAGVMVTFTQVEDFCKFPDGQTVGSQQPEKDGTVVDQKDLNATKNLKKKGRKAGRKKRKMACMPTQTVKEEECEENRIACGFQNNTQIQISDNSESITDNPDETMMKLRKSTRTQKTNSDPVVENLSQECKSTVSLDITGETCSSSMQAVKCEDQYTVEKMPPRRGRPPSKKNKKLKLLLADLEDNTSPSVQISGLSPCQDNTENTVEAAASTEKLKIMDKNVIVTEQLGTDPPESLPSATDPLSHSIPTSFNEEGKTSLALPGTEQKQELCEEIAKEDLKIESKGTIKVLKGRKRGRKRRKPAKSLLTKYNITSECSTADQNDIVKPEKNVNEKTMLGSVEMISPITAGTYKIRHSRDAKTHIRPAVVPTSKLSDSCHNDTPSSTSRNHISNLNLDGIPNDDRLYVYSHPDKLYVSPSRRVQLPVINLDPDEPEEVLGSQNPGPKLPNGEITSQSNSTHLPQATSDQENTNPNSSASIKIMANDQRNYSRCEYQRSPTFVETSVDMEVETHAQEEESFECADCTEKLTSVLGLYEHYILHAMGDAYVQVH